MLQLPLGRNRAIKKNCLLEMLESRQLLAAFTVTNTNDSGVGSLRKAIADANANSGADLIDFDIGSGAQRIQPGSALPAITEALTIDGTSQSGFAGAPLIELSGFNGSGNLAANGLTINASNCVVAGLAINGFQDDGILISGTGVTANTIRGCYIGTNASGGDNGIGSLGREGIEIRDGAFGNTIGGLTVADRNIISGATFNGIFIDGADSGNNLVEGNFIGTNFTGLVLIGNGASGVQIAEGSNSNQIGGINAHQRNVISGNADSGVTIVSGGTSNNLVQGNYIGINAIGTQPMGNVIGVEITGGATGNIIGGSHTGEHNVISGNSEAGIKFDGLNTSSNIAWGNLIGTNPAGTHSIGNQVGLIITDQATNNAVGSYRPGRGNLISGNLGDGVQLDGVGVAGNVFRGNLIGSQINPRRALGNDGDGVFINDAFLNQFGAKIKGAGNLIAYNGDKGIEIQAGTQSLAGQRNTISRNAIFSNQGLGISLTDDDPTVNDSLDADTGPNTLLNYPILTTAVSAGGILTISGSYSGAAGTTVVLEFFVSPSVDVSNFGQGQQVIATAVVTTSALGTVTFSIPTHFTLPSGDVVTATATDSVGNTSEFSNAAGTGIITGTVFSDLNGNGVKSGAGETGISSARVFIDANSNNAFDNGEKSYLSDSNGGFIFALAPGTYIVRQVPIVGFTRTAGSGGYLVHLNLANVQVALFGDEPGG